MTAALSVRALAKHYGPVAAVRDASLDVAEGEIVGLLGPNGAGKTTTLECVLGLREPDAGTITVAGLDSRSHRARLKRDIGAVLQTTGLQDKITPRQAVRLFAAFHGRRQMQADAFLEQFGLTEKHDSPFESLSGGQRQRLALALAFVHEPRLLVLDEPTTGLDPQARRDLHTLIKERRATGCAVLLSTHDLAEAQQLCDRIVIIDGGRTIAAGSPAELIARAGGKARLRVRTNQAPALESLAALAGTDACTESEGAAVLTTNDLNLTTVALMRWLVQHELALVELQVLAPSLEDAFLALTGRSWTRVEDNP